MIIIIIIRLLQPLLYSPTFLCNFANEDHSSIKIVIQKDYLFKYLANLAANGTSQELGADATNIIAAISSHYKIDRPNMSVALHPK